jgi:hypothetical protein
MLQAVLSEDFQHMNSSLNPSGAWVRGAKSPSQEKCFQAFSQKSRSNKKRASSWLLSTGI